MSILGSSSGKSGTESRVPPAGLSIVAVGLRINGHLDGDGTVKIEGAVDGDVISREQVLVSKGGEVHGNLDAREAIIGGRVHGSIRATERVEIQAGAAVDGDIVTRRIVVAEGASINGQVRMGEAALEGRAASRTEPERPPVAAVPGIAPRSSTPVARVAVPPKMPASGPGT